MPTEATVAYVLVFNYADRVPLYRQAQIISRQSIYLDRSTLVDWVGQPMNYGPSRRTDRDLKRSTTLFMGETRATVLDPGSYKTKTGYL